MIDIYNNIKEPGIKSSSAVHFYLVAFQQQATNKNHLQINASRHPRFRAWIFSVDVLHGSKSTSLTPDSIPPPVKGRGRNLETCPENC